MAKRTAGQMTTEQALVVAQTRYHRPSAGTMSLLVLVKYGYCLVMVLMLLMWLSLVGAITDMVKYPPCVFNPLCTCSKSMPDLGIVLCLNVPLPRFPPQMNGSKAFMLHLENNGLRYIEPYSLQGTGLYRLEISHNPLPTVSDEAFLGLERSLWELKLQYNEFTDVPSKAVRHLQKLRLLDLTGNKIGEVSVENWRGLTNSLQTLILADNALSSLPTNSFSSLALLETLDLRRNHLEQLDVDVFRDGPPRLSRLLLTDNQLNSIPYQQLSSLHMLRTLDLASNNIVNLYKSKHQVLGTLMSLDTLRLDYNQIKHLPSRSLQHFHILNRTYLDGNPLLTIEADAFSNTGIRELSIQGCGLTNLSEGAFAGLEKSLQLLNLGANNLTGFPHHLFHEFNFLHTLSLRENKLSPITLVDSLQDSQVSLNFLDLSGPEMGITSLQDLHRIHNLRVLSLSHLSQSHLTPEDFTDFSMDLEELYVKNSDLAVIRNHAFRHVRGIKTLDLSENKITHIENEAFIEIGQSLVMLRVSHGLASSVTNIPVEALQPLTSMQHLDLSNNKIRSMPENSFHSLKRLQVLKLQDNQIDNIYKGTFQGGIHADLEALYLSFNSLQSVNMHTFVDFPSLECLQLDDNRITRIEHGAFINMDQLKRLDLRGNKLKIISDEAFQNLPELELLDLAYNQLQSLDFSILDQVGTLSSFHLNASHNALQRLETNTTTGRGSEVLSNVKVLDLSSNNISHIGHSYLWPVEHSLTHLHLSKNRLLNATREVFGTMLHLQWLDLSNNQLMELAFDTFHNTRALQVLLLSHNQLTNIPTELFKSTSGLRIVDLSHNKLHSLPDMLFTESGLEGLTLSHNFLRHTPLSSLGTAAMATLCDLDLSWNLISELNSPDVFSWFKVLMWLDLSHNRLLRIEDSTFLRLSRLSLLDLSHNSELVLETRGRSFKGLEDSLLELHLCNTSLGSTPELLLPALRTLRLAQNHIQDIPIEVARSLNSLQQLDVSYNQLQAMPPAARSMPHLRYMELAANPITTLSNASFQGAMEHLQELDIRHLTLNYFEPSALSGIRSLRTLHVSPYPNVPDFNIPQIIQQNTGLRNLHIQALEKSDLDKEMSGPLPNKVQNITLSGRGFTQIPHSLLRGVRSNSLHFTLHNTSVETLPQSLFQQVNWVQNLSIDVRKNSLHSLGNPNTGEFPGGAHTMFTTDLQLEGNRWICDCQIGWIEMWQRKKRQYMCPPDKWNKVPECREIRAEQDDLREAQCENHNNASLIEVLKLELECGWGSEAPVNVPLWVLGFVVILPIFLSADH